MNVNKCTRDKRQYFGYVGSVVYGKQMGDCDAYGKQVSECAIQEKAINMALQERVK